MKLKRQHNKLYQIKSTGYEYFLCIVKDGMFPNLLHQASIIKTPKPKAVQNKNYRSISFMNIIAKILKY